MSKLDEELKKLKFQKLKAEFFKLIKENLEKIDSSKFKDVADEVKTEVKAFVDAQIDMIESGEIRSNKELSELFTTEEVGALKILAERALKKPLTKNISEESSQVPTKPEKRLPVDMSKHDKLSFALKHRNLGNKKVTIPGKGDGVCVGLDAPYVIVKMNSGVTIQAEPEEIVLL